MDRLTEPPLSRIVAAASLVILVVVLVRAELRERALLAEVHALAKDVSSLRSSLAEREPSAPLAMPASCALSPTSLQPILDAIATANKSHPGASKDSEAPPARTPEQDGALAHAHDTLDAALHRGRLARADITSIRDDFRIVNPSPQERDAFNSAIAKGIGEQRLVPDDPHFIYP
jgi:hypothetical protein